MKIFLSFLQGPDNYKIPAYSFWERYIKNGIEEAGFQWVENPEADWVAGIVPKNEQEQLAWKEKTWQNTIDWLKKHPVDLFLSYLYPQQVDSSAIKEIQKLGIPCVNFFCDNVREFRKAPKEYEVFDLNWVPEYKALKIYRDAGYKYIHLPMPVWILPEDRVIKPEKFNQITFLGSIDIQRHLLMEEIIKEDPNLPLAIYGSGWKKELSTDHPGQKGQSIAEKIFNQVKFIADKGLNAYFNKINNRNYKYETSPELLKKYMGGHQNEQYKVLTAESMITVGVNRYPSFHFPLDKPDTYSRLRDIEAPMLGACYLTEWTEGIEDMYEPGVEIAVYKNAHDFSEIANELLKDEEGRKSLKINGQKRSLNDHSIPQTLNKIINKLKK